MVFLTLGSIAFVDMAEMDGDAEEWDEERYGAVDADDWQGYDGDLDAVTEEGVPKWLQSVRTLSEMDDEKRMRAQLARRAMEDAKKVIKESKTKLISDNNEIERYNTIKEASEKNNIGRGVIYRMVESKQFRDGFGFKIVNKENKVSILTKKDKKNLIKDYDDGMTIDDLSKKYGKVKRYMKVLVDKLKSELIEK